MIPGVWPGVNIYTELPECFAHFSQKVREVVGGDMMGGGASLRTSSFARELEKREKKGEGGTGGRERENEPAGMYLRPPVKMRSK